MYGRLAHELAAQGAEAVAFDVIFGELRPDHAPVQMADALDRPARHGLQGGRLSLPYAATGDGH